MAAVALPDWLDYRPRLFPSCNFAWLRGRQPVLVEGGFGTDLEATLALLPDEPALVFNTHWHSDHVGGNAGLANRFGMPISCAPRCTIVQDIRYRRLLRFEVMTRRSYRKAHLGRSK
jgi:glyoxylase-like metal-dependent hydrolase (beta-lactamase superfamily II)